MTVINYLNLYCAAGGKEEDIIFVETHIKAEEIWGAGAYPVKIGLVILLIT
jgi:hypothetical protein